MRTAIDLPPATARRIQELATETGRSADEQLREIIERGLEDAEDYHLAARESARVARGEEQTVSLESVMTRLGLDR